MSQNSFPKSWSILGLIFLITLSWGVFTWPLLTRHEARRAEIVRQSLESQNWLLPSYQKRPYVTKPPLFTWEAMGLARLLGLREGTLRLPALLAAVFSLILIFLVTKKETDLFSALWAFFILFSTHKFFLLARRIELEVPFAFLCLLALLSFWWHFSRGKLLYRYLAFGFGALAFLTKGPLAFIIFPALPVYGLWQREKRVFMALLDPLGWLIFSGIGLSWYAYTYYKLGPGPFHEFIYVDILGRIKRSHHDPFYQYFLNLLANSLPWSLILFYKPRRFFRERISSRPFLLYSFLNVAVPLLLLSFTARKFGKYLLPLYPSWAIVLGAWWNFFLQEKKIPLLKASYGAAGLSLILGLGHVLAEPYLNHIRVESLKSLETKLDHRRIFLFRFYDPALNFYYPELWVLEKPQDVLSLPPGSLILVQKKDLRSLSGLPLKEKTTLEPFLKKGKKVFVLEKVKAP